jgi:hypothetical protein
MLTIDIAQYEIGCARYVAGHARPSVASDQRTAWDDMESARLVSAAFKAGNGEFTDVCWEFQAGELPIRMQRSVRCF